ncbi:hypothetical protein BDN72DRAFT_628228 [Pluteus cervinus]|uniref:Uncharacterized protein n=1 Tax=Pluteus cervinus TaxID=181527 RepID=A0ACD3A0E7_9AGAR|nr:hypothetical protein BDN72DRAFT_628228 [Pluteus cervinus]
MTYQPFPVSPFTITSSSRRHPIVAYLSLTKVEWVRMCAWIRPPTVQLGDLNLTLTITGLLLLVLGPLSQQLRDISCLRLLFFHRQTWDRVPTHGAHFHLHHDALLRSCTCHAYFSFVQHPQIGLNIATNHSLCRLNEQPLSNKPLIGNLPTCDLDRSLLAELALLSSSSRRKSWASSQQIIQTRAGKRSTARCSFFSFIQAICSGSFATPLIVC